jgi:hypothetical protein
MYLQKYSLKVSTYYGVTVDRVWIGKWIYSTYSTYSSLLHVTDHCYTQSSVLSHELYQSSADGFQQWTFPFFWIPDMFPCLNYSASLLAQYLQNCTAYNIS